MENVTQIQFRNALILIMKNLMKPGGKDCEPFSGDGLSLSSHFESLAPGSSPLLSTVEAPNVPKNLALPGWVKVHPKVIILTNILSYWSI